MDADEVVALVTAALSAVPRLALAAPVVGEAYRRGLTDGVHWAWFNNYAESSGAKWDHEGYLTKPGGVFDQLAALTGEEGRDG